MKRRCRETGACLDREKLGIVLFLQIFYKPGDSGYKPTQANNN